MVRGENESAQRGNAERGNDVQGQPSSARNSGNTDNDRLLLQEGRRIANEVRSQNAKAKLSSHQRRLLAAQYAISRELAYRDTRLAAIKESLGLEEGKPTSLDEIADIFEKTNTDKEVKILFDKILAINKRLGTTIDVQGSQEEGASGEARTHRDVHYYLDGFTRTSPEEINIPVVIAHELLHQGTVGAINLVIKGKAEGVLTKEQIDAVNTIIDIYNKARGNKEAFAENDYGLQDPYEFAAQMADPRQRRALSMSPLERVIAAANELRAQGNPSLWQRIKNALKTLFGMSDLKKMDRAINTLLDTFSETVHDISMNDVDRSGWGYTSTQLFDKYPTYLKYYDINGKYDVVISNAVLNVIPDDWRADVLKNMADKVKPGGKMIINVRDAKEMARQKQKIELDSPSEILVTDKAGNIRAYQKGFTQKELADWIQSELGEGWTIETAKLSNSGISGRAVVVTRNTDTPLRYRKIDGVQSLVETSNEKIQKIFKGINRNGFNDVTLQHVNELFNEIENGKAVYNRYNQSETQGLVKAGRAAFGASLAASYVAASQGAGRYGKIVAGQSANEQLEKVKEYAKAEGLWIDNIPSLLNEKYGEHFAEGLEAQVYMANDGKTVVPQIRNNPQKMI